MRDLTDWLIANGFAIGSGMLVVAIFMIAYVIVGLVRDRRDDDFQPIGQPIRASHRLVPFDKNNVINRSTTTYRA